MPLFPDTDARYPHSVGTRQVDRSVWASEVARLVNAHERGNKTAFARAVAINPKTVTRWLAETVDVSEESVRQVATVYGIDPLDLLVRVGYYTADEANRTGTDDEEIQLVVTDPNLTPADKKRVIDYILERRDRERAQGIESTRLMIEALRDKAG